MAFVKHIELCSYYRNRTQWANIFNFSVANINNKHTHYNDPVCDSAPIIVFSPLPRVIPVNIQVLKDMWNVCVGNFNPLLNAYRGTSVSGRLILESITLPNRLLFKTTLLNVQSGAFIDTKTDLSNGILHLPGLSPAPHIYNNWIITNETLGTSTPVLEYISHCLFFKAMPAWDPKHTFSLRKTNEITRRRITTHDLDVEFSKELVPTDVNCFVRVISTNQFSRILHVEGSMGKISPHINNLVSEPCEIIPISRDNAQPFNFVNYGKVYMMELLGISLPNIRLKNNTKLFELDAICVNVFINSFGVSNIYSTNNPNIINTCFLVNISKKITKLNKDNLTVYFDNIEGPAIETNMCDISEIRVICRDLYGNQLEPLTNDFPSPLSPNQDMQIRLSLKLVST